MTFLGILGLIISAVIGIIIGFAIGNTFGAVVGLIIAVAAYLSMAIRIIYQYERGLKFRLGKFKGVLNPGFIVILPFIEEVIKINLRVEVADAPPQEIITKDNIPLNINAVAYYRVQDPVSAYLNVDDYRNATFQISQTTIRSIVGQYELDEVISQRDEINARLKETIDKDTDAWGVKIEMIELKDVELPNNLKRAMAKQAEAERERRARIILASGELEASEKLAEAGTKMTTGKGALQLRLLQTLSEISVEKNSTIVFPMPLELMEFFKNFSDTKALKADEK
jgi:regulator of protease activity HflC (stomatin/prohibitin superfamily)